MQTIGSPADSVAAIAKHFASKAVPVPHDPPASSADQPDGLALAGRVAALEHTVHDTAHVHPDPEPDAADGDPGPVGDFELDGD